MSHLNLLLILVTLLANVFLALLVLVHGPRKKSHIYFFLFIVTITFWATAEGLSNLPIGEANQKLALYLDFASAPIGAYLYLLFARNFPTRLPNSIRTFVVVLLILAVLFSILSFTTSLIIKEVIVTPIGSTVRFGEMDWIYALFILLLIILGADTLYKQYRHNRGHEKLQTLYVLIGTLIPGVLISVTVLILWRVLNFNYSTSHFATVTIPSIARASLIFLTVTTSYAILKHRLFGIRIVLSKILFWLGTGTLFYLSFYGLYIIESNLVEDLLSVDLLLFNFGVAMFFSLLFSLYEGRLLLLLRKYLVDYSYEFDEVVKSFNSDIIMIESRGELSKALFNTLKTTISPVKKGVIVAFVGRDSEYVDTEYYGFTHEDNSLLGVTENVNAILSKAYVQRVITRNNLGTDREMLKLLKALQIEGVVSCNVGDYLIVCLVGKKQNEHAYLDKDFTLIQELIYYYGLNIRRTDMVSKYS